MSETKELLRRGVGGVEPVPDAFDRVLARRDRRQRNRRIGSALVALLVAGLAIGGLLRAFADGAVPADDPRTPFLGTWVGGDDDGSLPTMTVTASGDAAVEIEEHDPLASACGDAASTMTGTGQITSATELVVPFPILTCDDGAEPLVQGDGPAPEEELRNLTFVHDPETDALTDAFGVVWVRRSGDPNEPTTPGIWPQRTLEEIQDAQRLADEGDPGFTWQVDAELVAGSGVDDAEIFARFLREELGWEAFVQNPFIGSNEFSELSYNTSVRGIAFVRCAPGQTNAQYPEDARAGTCAPTLDGLRYETVSVDVARLDRHGPTGVWVVTGWRTLPPFQQMTPPSDAEIGELLDAFLAARVAGEGAEQYLRDVPEGGIPLLYATTAGAPYERGESDRLSGPAWPDGETVVEVRLFAEGEGTLVEQAFSLSRPDGRLGLTYLADGPGVAGTTENGQAVGEPYRILDGQVTYSAAPPWRLDGAGWLGTDLLLDDSSLRFEVAADPRPSGAGCQEGPASADAAALARTIRSDPDLDVTAPVPTRVAGIDALRMDLVAAPGARVCDGWVAGAPVITESVVEPGSRMRLYVLDLHGMSARILTIAIVAPEANFEQVAEAAAPIMDSLELHTG